MIRYVLYCIVLYYIILYYIILYNIIILWNHRSICGPSLTEMSLCGVRLLLYKQEVNWIVVVTKQCVVYVVSPLYGDNDS
jgi:hypothetical protein